MIASNELEMLLVLLKQGDPRAFRELHTRYAKPLLRVIVLIVKDSCQAEDVLQDTFVKVWQYIHHYDSQKGGLYNWMSTVARHTAIDSLRRRTPPVIAISDGDPEGVLVDKHDWLRTDCIGVEQVARRVLRTHQWQVVQLVYWKGRTQQEIADELGLPLGTVKTHVRLSLIRLRPFFS
ncbi:RNA polymerase sigma factor [Spirosoma utsteinense]|uniref:RNA polymerase sigma-70 factor (ECF subfamily) n=1 Tax=Spirosoma utsteinense TaxID=2585773 RepID=A0ABR6WFG9_9BACT|nr:sigma-70 family RNA polymerase sigma factor [Spirosoma utsteinense]MBC3789352.1 RNA polymerase sigma-70 factor (ECF subfamily) [Spirosoma utsteinense]MBC3795248.1 RNA polymerase sigma-70 factor (ECF subfamily) [Spirosoma utsteinense]